MQKKVTKTINGFTLIEVLLVISLLAILTAVTIIAINPAYHLAKSRDAERSTDVYTLLTAVHQYAVDHDGSYPDILDTTSREICKTDSVSCTGLYDLSVLTTGQEYLVSIPQDPRCESDGLFCSVNGVGYFIQMTSGGKITVSAPYAEVGDEISVTR